MNRTRNHVSALLAALLIIAMPAAPAAAQNAGDPVTIGVWHEIESSVLGEKRRIIIGTPPGYEQSDENCAVLYLLDGDAHFHHTTGLVNFLIANDEMPPTIVVAVPNTDRTRDLSPPSQTPLEPMFSTAGGANNFIQFFDEELVPYVEANFRTHPFRILIGHSFGGLFAVHTLVHKLDLFNAYLAISPSLQWDEQRLVGQADAFFDEHDQLKKWLYMTTGNEGGALTGGVLKLCGSLKEKAPRGFSWDVRIMEEESHNSVVYRSTRQGLRFIFKDWGLRDPMPLYKQGGLDAIVAHYQNSQELYGFERTMPPGTVTQIVAQLAFSGRLGQARELLEHDPQRYPPHPVAYSMLASQYMQRDDKDNAIECYTKLLQMNPGSDATRQSLRDLGVNPDEIVITAQVDIEQLKPCVGVYALGEGSGEVAIELNDTEQLTATISGSSPMVLFPREDGAFFLEAGPVVTFERDDSGRVVAFTVTGPGTNMRCPRKDVAGASANDGGAAPAALDFTMESITGEDVHLATAYGGDVVLMVNVASRCGFTPQYEGLQALHTKYAERGLRVLGFPANNFRGQEPGTNAEILQFCTERYSVGFPMFAKVSVSGDDICPLYKLLTDSDAVKESQGDIRWNFEKFLLDRSGNVIKHYRSRTKPEEIEADITALLEQK